MGEIYDVYICSWDVIAAKISSCMACVFIDISKSRFRGVSKLHTFTKLPQVMWISKRSYGIKCQASGLLLGVANSPDGAGKILPQNLRICPQQKFAFQCAMWCQFLATITPSPPPNCHKFPVAEEAACLLLYLHWHSLVGCFLFECLKCIF